MLTSSFPYWSELIYKWVNAGHNGLTVPYILGVSSVINKEHRPVINDVDTLFAEIINAKKVDWVPVLKECNTIEKPILGIYTKLDGKLRAIKNQYGEEKLYVTDEVVGNFLKSEFNLTLQEIIKYFKGDEYALAIGEGNYSWLKREDSWIYYSDSELEFIRSVLKC